MTTIDVGISVAVRFDLPWFVCHADGWGTAEQLDRAVDQRLEADPDLGPSADVLRSQVVAVAKDFRREGAVVGALRFQRDPVFGIVTAYCSAMLVVLDEPLDGSAMIERLRVDLGHPTPADASRPEVDDVEVDGRPALRLAVTRLAPEVEPGEGQPAFLVVEHWVPVAEAPGHIVRLAAMTSRLAFAAELSSEFDTIASTLRVTVGS